MAADSSVFNDPVRWNAFGKKLDVEIRPHSQIIYLVLTNWKILVHSNEWWYQMLTCDLFKTVTL